MKLTQLERVKLELRCESYSENKFLDHFLFTLISTSRGVSAITRFIFIPEIIFRVYFIISWNFSTVLSIRRKDRVLGINS
jgi:hypothetical protein